MGSTIPKLLKQCTKSEFKLGKTKTGIHFPTEQNMTRFSEAYEMPKKNDVENLDIRLSTVNFMFGCIFHFGRPVHNLVAFCLTLHVNLDIHAGCM